MIQIAIKAGQILHVANRFVVDRIQTGGAGNLNIPTEKVYELGNFQSVAVVRDVPDLTFTLDCLDVSTEVEAILAGGNPGGPTPNAPGAGGDADGTKYTFTGAVPLDVISPMKSRQDFFDVVRGVAVPHLTLESVSYRYGLRENAGEQYSLRGDSIFYIPGVPHMAEWAHDGVDNTFTFDPGPALLYTEGGSQFYALSVSADDYRLVHGEDYTDDPNGLTLTQHYLDTFGDPTGRTFRVTWGVAVDALNDQDQRDRFNQDTTHQGVLVKPAAIRGKDIDAFVGTHEVEAEMVPFRWSEVQSVNVDWRVTLEDDYEFGNPRAVSREPTDAPEVTGSIEIKPMTPESLFRKLNQITGVDADDIVGPQSSVVLPIEVRLRNPDSGGVEALASGTVMKTLYIPDARFTIPGYEGRVQQKLVNTLNFESDTGLLEVFKGARPEPA